MKDLYTVQKKSIKYIANHFNLTRKQVYYRLELMGVDYNGCNRITEEDQVRMYNLYKLGHSFADISKITKLDIVLVPLGMIILCFVGIFVAWPFIKLFDL